MKLIEFTDGPVVVNLILIKVVTSGFASPTTTLPGQMNQHLNPVIPIIWRSSTLAYSHPVSIIDEKHFERKVWILYDYAELNAFNYSCLCSCLLFEANVLSPGLLVQKFTYRETIYKLAKP